MRFFHFCAHEQFGPEQQVSDQDLTEAMIVSSDPATHVERIREVVELGATAAASR